METNLFDAVVHEIGTASPKAVSEAIGQIGQWGATDAQYISFLQSKGYSVFEGTNGRYMIYKVDEFLGGNGAATKLLPAYEATGTEIVVEGAQVTELTTTGTGAGILGMEVGAAGLAIAPALGILAGVGLYNLAPDFWDDVSSQLVDAGKMIGNKVAGLIDESGITSFDQETIEIFKNAFINAGLFEETIENFPSTAPTEITIDDNYHAGHNYNIIEQFNAHDKGIIPRMKSYTWISGQKVEGWFDNIYARADWGPTHYPCIGTIAPGGGKISYLFELPDDSLVKHISNVVVEGTLDVTGTVDRAKQFALGGMGSKIIYDGETKYAIIVSVGNNAMSGSDYINDMLIAFGWNVAAAMGADYNDIAYLIPFAPKGSGNLQPGATYPTQDPFNQTYTNWHPSSTINNNNYYPVSYPTDNITQQPSQSGQNSEKSQIDGLLETIFDIKDEPGPEPDPKEDPDPQPEPEPLPTPTPTPTPTDPIDPNPIPVPSPVPIIPDLPSVVSSNSIFTVYNPSTSQLNSFGSWLWSSSIVDQLVRMWQNPLDGIISLIKVYAAPLSGSTRNIIVGYLNSEVSAPVVSSQFITITCGTVEIKELKKNSTDYTPYVDLHLYLPFIGFVELDPDDFMNGVMTVTYHIDVYTGTCTAEVRCTRTTDMPSATVIYTFSGNASQQLPLTSGSASGLLSMLGTISATLLTGGSGGALVSTAKTAAIGHSLTHEMFHVGHSGSLSANAGLLGYRKPYVIIGRRHGYDANSYNYYYGYPCNKTVYLGNCEGFTRVKAGMLKTAATQLEKDEIMELLHQGVIM